jgi:hypothetical protein
VTTPELSVSGWFKCTQGARIFQHDFNSSSGTFVVHLPSTSQTQGMFCLPGNTSHITMTSNTPTGNNQWHHVVITKSTSSTPANLYLDGVLVATYTSSFTLNNGVASLYFGNAETTYNLFNGSVDDIRIYNRELTQSEVTALYNESPTYSVTTSSNPTNGGYTTGSGTFQTGSQVTVVATPYSGWTFTNWTENSTIISTSPSYSFFISNNRNLIANFSQLQVITVTSPNGGEIWQSGTTHNITWTSSGINNVNIAYSYDNGTSWSLIVNGWAASSGSYNWIVPNTPSTECLVKISDASNLSIYDISDNLFTITGGNSSIFVLSPNGGEIWQVGSNYNIAWTSSGVSFVNIEYTTDNGNSWSTIVSNIPSSSNNSYPWTVPNTPSNQCRVRITDVNDPTTWDQSNNVFTILGSGSAITVISPNGNEIWQVGFPYYIIWNSINVSNVRIDYSIDNGFSWILITYSTPASTGYYSWIVPNTPSMACIMKVSDASNSALFDVSNADFTISPITGLGEPKSEIKLFPNPTSGNLKVVCDETIENVVVYNSLGAQVINKSVNNSELVVDLSQYSKGVYFLRLTIGEKVLIHKIILL